MNNTYKLPQQQYITLDSAYTFFNKRMFGGKLPPLLITFRKKTKAYGYYWHEAIESRKEASPVSELALNIALFDGRTDKQILSTLVHEMEPSRSGYHNKQWAEKMKEIGLYPSNTGAEGGKETGQSVTHYVIEDGIFDKLYEELATEGISIDWQSSYEKKTVRLKKAKPEPKGGTTGGEGDDNEDDEDNTPVTKNKTKFTCPKCHANAWGRPSLKIICGLDNISMEGE